MSRNLLIRTLSSVVLVAVMMSMLLWNGYSRYIILSVIGIAGCWEMLTIFRNGGVQPMRIFVLLSGVILLVCNFYALNLYIPISVLFVARCCAELYRKNAKPLESIAYEILAIVYTILPMILLYNNYIFSIFAVIIFVWINDAGAYLVGSAIGNKRLFQRISPKKSWEGFWGGFVLTLAASVAAWYIIGAYTVWYWIIAAAAVSIASVFGDLFESMIKRSLNIKDSGNIIPGHGGILDRFDALFFASFAYYVVSTINEYIIL